MRRWAGVAVILCVLWADRVQTSVLDDIMSVFELDVQKAVIDGESTSKDLTSALGFREPIIADDGVPSNTALNEVTRPWRDCSRRFPNTHDYWPTGEDRMITSRWPMNEAFMCRDSQRNYIISYQFQGVGDTYQYQRDQFEVNGKMLLPRPSKGRLPTRDEDIFPCDLHRKTKCWEGKEAPAQAVVPFAGVVGTYHNFCWAKKLLVAQSDTVPDLCYPSSVYQGSGCTQLNQDRACFVEQLSEFIVIAHFPWQIPDADTSYDQNKLHGPSKVTKSSDTWTIESMQYTTGQLPQCRTCTIVNTLGGFGIDRVLSMPDQRTAVPEMESCASEASDLAANHDMFMHAYQDNRQLDLTVVSATSATYGTALSDTQNILRAAFDGLAQEEHDAAQFDNVVASSRSAVQKLVNSNGEYQQDDGSYAKCPELQDLKQVYTDPYSNAQVVTMKPDPCESIRYKGVIPKEYTTRGNDIEPMHEEITLDITDKKLTDAGARLSDHILCPYAFTAGCVSWYGSKSQHVCESGIVNTTHSRTTWLQEHGIAVEGAPQGEAKTLAVFVPGMLTDPGFSSAYMFGLRQSDDRNLGGALYTIPASDGSRTIYVTKEYFRIDVLLHGSEENADNWNIAPVTCRCEETKIKITSSDAEEFAEKVYGAVARNVDDATQTVQFVDSTNTGLFHECRLCSGREFRKSDPFKKQVCGAVTHTCAPCRESVGTENSLRSRDGERCITCPRAHVVSQWNETVDATRSTLEELLRGASEQYGWGYLDSIQREDLLIRLQAFGDQSVYDHIRGRFIDGGGWSCHVCPAGYVLVQDVLSFHCRLLNLVTVNLDISSQNWQLSASCMGDAVECDEVTIDEERTTARVIKPGRYLVINTTSQQISEQVCPTGVYRHPNDGIINPPLHTGLFRHLCGRPYASVYLRATLAYCDPSQITGTGMSPTLCDTWPRLGEKHILDTSTNKFMQITQDTDMATVLQQRIDSYYPTVASSVEWEMVREGVEQACGTCAQGKYNSGCNNNGGGSFGTCVACKTNPLPGSWLKHALGRRGCDKWLLKGTSVLSGEFVDRDYEDTPCRHVLEVGAGDLYLCAGFCGQLAATGTASFRWWNEPTAANPELVGTRTCAHPGDGTDCQWNGANLGTATKYEECSTEVPYCPLGFYVNTLKAGCERETILGQPFLVDGANAKCCALCLQNCPEEKMRSNTWQVCPGYTTYDTQDACTAGCDIGYYKQIGTDDSGDSTETCAPCTSCEAGLNAV